MGERLASKNEPRALHATARATAPLRTLPGQPTPLIGREQDLAALQSLLWRSEVRLITLTGAGGIGKTRLALAVAEAAGQLFTDGVRFIDLSAVREPELVPAMIARTLEIAADPQQTLVAAIQAWLNDRDLLLVLDNCEQVSAAGTQFARWLRACPRLVLLATSRLPLQLSWEHEYPVAPLRLPAQDQRHTPDELGAIPAVALFVARAQSIRPGFVLDADNAASIAALCQRLDGLPLAIELAAHLMRLFSPRAVLERLEARHPLPSAIVRDLPERQQSLHATVEWSYELLSPTIQTFFRSLGAIPGSFTLELAGAVGAALDPALDAETLEGCLRQLHLHNLLGWEQDAAGGRRFAMLNTIRSYAAAQLAAHGEAAAAQGALDAWALALAERAGANLIGPNQAQWLERLDLESPTLQQALRGAIERGDTALALRMVAALWWSWYVRGLCAEGRAALEATLALPGEEATPARARALIGVGALAYLQGDIAAAVVAGTAGLALGRQLENQTTIALGLNLLGNAALWKGDHTLARMYYETQITSQRRLAEAGPLPVPAQFGLALSLNNLGVVCQEAGQDARAADLHVESLALMRKLGDRQGIAHTLLRLGEVRLRLGKQGEAAALAGESLQLFRTLGDQWGTARALLVLGRVNLRHDEAAALAALREGLAMFHQAGIRLGVIECCEALAEVGALRRQFVQATRLLAAATAQREAIDAVRTTQGQADHERLYEHLHRALGERDFMVAWVAGGLLTLEQAIAAGLTAPDVVPDHLLTAPSESALAPRLTRRERQVVALLARGMTNRQIAEQLFNSERTIETHVQKIAGKLGLSRRTQIATWANANGLRDDAMAAG